MKYVILLAALFPVATFAACLLPEDVSDFLAELDASHFAGLATHVDSSRPAILTYRFTLDEHVAGSIMWCWRTAVAPDGSELDCLSPGPFGFGGDYDAEEERTLVASFQGVSEAYDAFVKEFDIEPELLELRPSTFSLCDAKPASNKSQQEDAG